MGAIKDPVGVYVTRARSSASTVARASIGAPILQKGRQLGASRQHADSPRDSISANHIACRDLLIAFRGAPVTMIANSTKPSGRLGGRAIGTVGIELLNPATRELAARENRRRNHRRRVDQVHESNRWRRQ